jgi:hypothetical protein
VGIVPGWHSTIFPRYFVDLLFLQLLTLHDMEFITRWTPCPRAEP